jgi:hypothetical protein
MKIVRNIRIEQQSVFIDGIMDYRHDSEDFGRISKGIYRHYGLDYPKFFKMSPLSRLGFLASELLLMNQDLSVTDPSAVALYLANASSSLHTDAIYQASMADKPSPAVFVYTLPNIMIGEICIRNGFHGEGIFFIQEEYDKSFVQKYAENQLNAGTARICIAGWVEMNEGGNYLADVDLLK